MNLRDGVFASCVGDEAEVLRIDKFKRMQIQEVGNKARYTVGKDNKREKRAGE